MNAIRNAAKTAVATIATAAALCVASPAIAQIPLSNLCRTYYWNGVWAGDFYLRLPPAPIGTSCYWTFSNGVTVYGFTI